MYARKGSAERLDKAEHFRRRKPAAKARRAGFERFAFHKVHHDIRGSVFVEEPAHAHNGRFIGESCQNLRLADELFPAFLEEGFLLAGQRHNGGMRPPVAGNASFGIIFLDCHFEVQVEIEPDIRDSEPALPQHAADQIRPRENAPAVELVGRVFRGGVVKPADRANPLGLFQLRHAVHADHAWINHTFSLFHSAGLSGSPSTLP